MEVKGNPNQMLVVTVLRFSCGEGHGNRKLRTHLTVMAYLP
jgi:hypothetical protein